MTHSVMLEASKPISKKVKKTSISTVIRNVEAIDPVEAWKEKLRIIFLVGEPGSDGVSLAEELRMKLGHHLISSGKAIKDLIDNEGLEQSLYKTEEGELMMDPPIIFRAIKHALRGVLDSYPHDVMGSTEQCFIIEGFPCSLALAQAFESQIQKAQLLIYIKTFAGIKKTKSEVLVQKTPPIIPGWGKGGTATPGGFTAVAPPVPVPIGSKGWGMKVTKQKRSDDEVEQDKKREEENRERLYFRSLTSELRERFKGDSRYIEIWGGRPHQEMIHDLAGLFEEVPVKVLVETKMKSKQSVLQHKSHPNDTVSGGLVTSGIQANSSSHTFFRGGEGTTIKVQFPNANKNAVMEQSVRMDLCRWLCKLGIWENKQIEEVDLWRRQFGNGYMMAELLHHYFPRSLDLHTFDPSCSSWPNKTDNWKRIVKVLRFLNFRFRPLGTDFDITLCMRERKDGAVNVLRRFYLGMCRQGRLPQTNFLKLAVEEEKEEQFQDVQGAKVHETDHLAVALAKIRNALNSRMKPNIKAFQGKPLNLRDFNGLMKLELRVTFTGKELIETFKYFDTDNSGEIDYGEIIHKLCHKQRLSVSRPVGTNKDTLKRSPKKRCIVDKNDKTIRLNAWRLPKESTVLSNVDLFVEMDDKESKELVVGAPPEDDFFWD